MTVDLVPLKYVATVNDDKLDESTDPAYEFDYIDIGAVGRGRLVEAPERISFQDAPSRARRRVRPGDTIVSTVRTYLRAVWAVEGRTKDLVVSTGFAVVRPRSIDARFLRWAVQSDTFVESVVAASTGVSYPAINPGDLASLPIPIPSAQADQRRIADFLDAETARIDALITAKQRVSVLLVDRFREHVRLTTSGGEPVALRRVVDRVKTGATPNLDVYGGTPEQLPWYSPSDIGNELELTSPSRWLEAAAVSDGQVPTFAPDSVLMVGIGATAGRVAYLDHEASGNQQITAVETSRDLDARFLAWYLWARSGELRALAPYTTLPILNNDYLRSVTIGWRPVSHQVSIASRLDAEALSIRRLIGSLTHQCELLGERRRALITAAVTGEMAV